MDGSLTTGQKAELMRDLPEDSRNAAILDSCNVLDGRASWANNARLAELEEIYRGGKPA